MGEVYSCWQLPLDHRGATAVTEGCPTVTPRGGRKRRAYYARGRTSVMYARVDGRRYNNEQIILPTKLIPFSAATEENLAATQIESIVNIKNPAFAILVV